MPSSLLLYFRAKTFLSLLHREKQVLSMYIDHSTQCHESEDKDQAVFWMDQPVHYEVMDELLKYTAQLKCESVLREDNELPDHYNDEDVADYRDWIAYETIQYFIDRTPYLWLNGLYAQISDIDNAEEYSNAFHLFRPKFKPKTPDEKMVRLNCCRCYQYYELLDALVVIAIIFHKSRPPL
jgi:hypothetical protein